MSLDIDTCLSNLCQFITVNLYLRFKETEVGNALTETPTLFFTFKTTRCTVRLGFTRYGGEAPSINIKREMCRNVFNHKDETNSDQHQ